MGYVKETLVASKGERVLIWGKFHWIYDLRAWSWLIFVWWLLGYGIYKFVKMMFRKYTTEIAVTNLRFIYKRGWLHRETRELSINRIESVDFHQTALGRLLNYGTLRIRGTGRGLICDLPTLSNPIKFRSTITRARAEFAGNEAPEQD